MLGLGLPTVLGLIVGGSVVQAVAILYTASLSDRFGRRRVLLGGCGALVVSALTFFPLADTRSLPLIVLAAVVVFAASGVYFGPQPAAFAELFSTGVRYSGISLSLQLGTILGGAAAPFAATALYGATGSSWSITAYLTALAVISLLCVLALKDTYRRDLTDEQQPSVAPETPVPAS